MKDNKTLSKKIKALEEGTNWFYSEDFNLDEAGQRYEALIKSAKELQGDLDKLKNKIEILNEDFSK